MFKNQEVRLSTLIYT